MPRQTSKQAEAIKIGYLSTILFFAFVPLLMMIVISFKTNVQFQENPWFFDPPSEWVWSNWSTAWDTMKGSILNSIFVSVTSATITLTMVCLTSYVLGRYRFPGRNLLYYCIIGTLFMPGIAASLVTTVALISKLGMINNLLTVIIMATVAGQVGGIYILKQVVEELPKELFEAAQMDGATHLQQIRYVLIPMCGSILSVILIMDLLQSWNSVILPMIVLQSPDLFTIPLKLLYLDSEYYKFYGELMASYAIGSLPLLAAFLLAMRFFVYGFGHGALKR